MNTCIRVSLKIEKQSFETLALYTHCLDIFGFQNTLDSQFKQEHHRFFILDFCEGESAHNEAKRVIFKIWINCPHVTLSHMKQVSIIKFAECWRQKTVFFFGFMRLKRPLLFVYCINIAKGTTDPTVEFCLPQSLFQVIS